mgnify:CR=1 FL=1
MLYDHIVAIQRKKPLFNRRPLSIEDLVEWCEEIGAKLIQDHRARHASAYWDGGRPIIRLNPNSSEALQIIILGHEIGHILLGHLEIGSELPFSIHNLFLKNRWERDASVIGYLCLIPTAELIRMVRNDIQGPEELFSELQPMFGDDEKLGMEICVERMKIFIALLDNCGGKCLEGEDCHVCGEAPPRPGPAAAFFNRPPADVRVVGSPYDVEPGGEYRFRSDGANVVRIRFQPPVTGRTIRLFARNVPVAGVSFGEALGNTTAFISGRDRSLILERDPGNQFDPNAIRVIARWRGATGSEHQAQIGWVPRAVAARVAHRARGIPLCGALKTLFRPDKGKNPGIRFEIWV